MPSKCNGCEETKVSKIKLDDDGSARTAVFLNPKREKHIKHRMDGGHQKNVTAADWMLTKPNVGEIVVELKGGDVTRAIEQAIETASFATSNNLRTGKIAALVLCTQHPGIDTKIQRLMQSFVKRFKGPVHVRNKSGEFYFEYVLSFTGPDKP